jgi:hypothetical protein
MAIRYFLSKWESLRSELEESTTITTNKDKQDKDKNKESKGSVMK